MEREIVESTNTAGVPSARLLRSIRMSLLGTAFAVPALTLAHAASASVIVHQTEASESGLSVRYAPVNFTTGPTRVVGAEAIASEVTFTGLTFNAMYDWNGVYSNHANGVAATYYGSTSVARPYVNTVYTDYVSRFLDDVVKPQYSPSTTATKPGSLGNGIQVSYHAWVGTYGAVSQDLDAVRRMDYMIDRDNLTMITGAVVNTTGTFTNANLAWSCRNAVAVRGSSGSTPFNPAGGQLNRQHVDVWSDGLASYSGARVASFAAGIIGVAEERGLVDATKNVVVRSMLMTGADKTVGATWARDTVNNLDVDLGAGKADYWRSVGLLDGGRRTLRTATALGGETYRVGGATIENNALRGWASGVVPAGGFTAVIFQTTGAMSRLTATLNWNVTLQSTETTIDTTDAGVIFADLGLELRPVTFDGTDFILGNRLPDTTLLSNISDNPATLSVNENDNVEHLYSTSSLSAGYWAFLIRGDAARATEIGFSYLTIAQPQAVIPLPEPGLAGVAIGSAGLLMRRRR